MSLLSNFLKYTGSSKVQSPIGDIVGVVCNSSNLPSTLMDGKFVKTGGLYSKTTYPDLFALIGQIYLSPSYDINTQFYVPQVSRSNEYTFRAGQTGVQIVYYMKAKDTAAIPVGSVYKTTFYRTDQTPPLTLDSVSVRSNTVFSQVDHSELYSHLGLITSSQSYNTSTQFFVPDVIEYTTNATNLNPIAYIRSKE
jgi:hypothetical protein